MAYNKKPILISNANNLHNLKIKKTISIIDSLNKREF